MSLSLNYRILKMSKGDSAYDLTYSETLEVCRILKELEEERNLLRQQLEGIPEGCTVADAKKLREANHALAIENFELKKKLEAAEQIIREAREQKPKYQIYKQPYDEDGRPHGGYWDEVGANYYNEFLVENTGARSQIVYAAPVPAVPEGWQLVPIDPTPEMIDGFWGEITHGEAELEAAKEAYAAMLSVAPKT